MTENLLYYIWRYRHFEAVQLHTTDGQTLEIIQNGEINTDSGPDFSNARIRIGETLWAGNVEIHVKSSDWLKHKHQNDRAYDNTILHVVYEEDTPIEHTITKQILPCFVLKGLVKQEIIAKYEALIGQKIPIPCASYWETIPPIVRFSWLDRLLIERLERKTTAIKQVIAQAQGNWDEAFYRSLARNFGQKVNADPFEQLAASLPMRILAKHKNQLFQIEALLFGQAGMLEQQFSEPYPESLRKEYHFLRQKYDLQPLQASQWKYFRMRPAGFPTIRIAQFADLVFQSSHLFSKILEVKEHRNLHHLLHAEVSLYWKTHYRFETESKSTDKPMSKELIQLMIYNTIVPFWFLYGRERMIPDLEERALTTLEAMPPESNHILTDWEEIGMKAKNAAQAQSLIQLKTIYCDQKRCASCAIGVQILKGRNLW
jgi:hypothetical protein